MAITDAKKRRIGRELVDWIHLGIRTGARRSVAEYQRLKVSDRPQAIEHLTRAVNMPAKARARIDKWISDYDAINGAGTGQVFIAECLTLAGSVTLGEINSDLTTLENQADTLITNNQSGGTLDEMAAAIESALEWEAKDWTFPIPETFTESPLLDN